MKEKSPQQTGFSFRLSETKLLPGSGPLFTETSDPVEAGVSVTAELFFSVLRSIFRSLFLRSNNKASGNEPIPVAPRVT